MNLKKKYGNYELHPQMKITGYENEIWDEKKEIIEELKRAVQEKQKEKKTCNFRNGLCRPRKTGWRSHRS